MTNDTRTLTLTEARALLADERRAKNPAVRLTPDAIRDIRRRVADGEKQADIARFYEVTPRTIQLIREKVTWVDVV